MRRSEGAVMAAQERVMPTSAEALSEIVGACDRAGEKVCVVGGNTLEGMSLPPERVDVTLDVTAVRGVAANERADLTLAVRAGTALQDVATLLAAQGMFVPFDAPQPLYATVGGTLAAGWAGPRRHLYGRVRDHLIGSTVVLADGTIARAGGMVVKNVAGYDMSRLYIGSFGTLGVLTQANFKTIPLPPHARCFLAPLPERTRGRAATQLASLSIRPSAAFVVRGFESAVDGSDGDEGRIFALVEGSDALLERATLEMRSALGRAGVPETQVLDAGARPAFERIVDAYTACVGERSVTYGIPSLAGGAQRCALDVESLARRLELRAESIVDVMNGEAVVRVSDADALALGAKIETFDEALHELHPRARVFASKHPYRTSLRIWGEPPAAIQQMKELKARFDPNRTLNPGRFIGGI
jgi:glycolate dehydrogenase FAD-binding subunit